MEVNENLLELKDKLIKVKKEMEEKLSAAKIKAELYLEVDKKLEDLVKESNPLMSLNVGGKIYKVKLSTLLSIKDTLFYYIIAKRVMNNLNPRDEIFIDKNHIGFDILLDYLQTKEIHLKQYNKKIIDKLYVDAEFLGFTEICDKLKNKFENA